MFGSLKNYISGRASADKQQAPSASTSTPRPAEITRESSALANRLQTMHPASPNDDHPGKFDIIFNDDTWKLISLNFIALKMRGLTEERPYSGSAAFQETNKILDNNLGNFYNYGLCVSNV